MWTQTSVFPTEPDQLHHVSPLTGLKSVSGCFMGVVFPAPTVQRSTLMFCCDPLWVLITAPEMDGCSAAWSCGSQRWKIPPEQLSSNMWVQIEELVSVNNSQRQVLRLTWDLLNQHLQHIIKTFFLPLTTIKGAIWKKCKASNHKTIQYVLQHTNHVYLLIWCFGWLHHPLLSSNQPGWAVAAATSIPSMPDITKLKRLCFDSKKTSLQKQK